jgi:DNA-binding HxlR family transcriptional regulator
MRSNCPISSALELIGDKWSLLILRDIIIFGKRHFDDFEKSDEGISTNILADRLVKLEYNGIINKAQDVNNKKRYIYSPTIKGLDLLPVMIDMVIWSARHDPHTVVPLSEIKKIKKDKDAYIKNICSKFIMK